MQWPPPLSSFKTFSSLHNNILYPLSSHFPFSISPIIWQALHVFFFFFFFVSMDLPILNISYKRNHKICDLLCLPFSLGMLLTFIQVVIRTRTSLFLWLNNISLYGHTITYWSIHPLVCILSVFWLLWMMLLQTLDTCFCLDVCVHFSWSAVLGLYGNSTS